MEYKKQVENTHYRFKKYFDKPRWASYWHQIDEIVSNPSIKSILEIGPGTEFLKSSLKIFRPDIVYHSFDIVEELRPDIVGSVTDIPLEADSYDLVCAFQVLEHIKFEDFELAIEEIKRVSKKYVYISLPHFGPSIEIWLKFPFVKRIKTSFKVPVRKIHIFGGQHYWEVGKKNYSPRKIRKAFEGHFCIDKEYVPFENQYHRFYIMRIK